MYNPISNMQKRTFSRVKNTQFNRISDYLIYYMYNISYKEDGECSYLTEISILCLKCDT